MATLLSVLAGIGLSAAAGFRVFVPLLVLSLAERGGYLRVSDGFAWVGSDAALIAFAVATGLEVLGYFIPWVDHALDVVATPLALVAGVLLTAAVVTDLDPFVRWTLAVLAGGGAAASFQGLTAGARGISTLSTGGIGNPLVGDRRGRRVGRPRAARGGGTRRRLPRRRRPALPGHPPALLPPPDRLTGGGSRAGRRGGRPCPAVLNRPARPADRGRRGSATSCAAPPPRTSRSSTRTPKPASGS